MPLRKVGGLLKKIKAPLRWIFSESSLGGDAAVVQEIL